LRKRRVCTELSIDGADDDREFFCRPELRDLSEDAERSYARREREELLNKAVLQLRPYLREAIQLRHIQEYSMQELAESLGISLAAAKSRLSRAKVALRTILQ
jgi:RNA polymerase sigma-70 factor, ECF subfamily